MSFEFKSYSWLDLKKSDRTFITIKKLNSKLVLSN